MKTTGGTKTYLGRLSPNEWQEREFWFQQMLELKLQVDGWTYLRALAQANGIGKDDWNAQMARAVAMALAREVKDTKRFWFRISSVNGSS
jgi:hypothetical protein